MCHYEYCRLKILVCLTLREFTILELREVTLINSQIFNLKKLISTTIRSSGSCTISPLSGLLSALYFSHRVAHSVTTPYYVCNDTYHNTHNYYQNTCDPTHTHRCTNVGLMLSQLRLWNVQLHTFINYTYNYTPLHIFKYKNNCNRPQPCLFETNL